MKLVCSESEDLNYQKYIQDWTDILVIQMSVFFKNTWDFDICGARKFWMILCAQRPPQNIKQVDKRTTGMWIQSSCLEPIVSIGTANYCSNLSKRGEAKSYLSIAGRG